MVNVCNLILFCHQDLYLYSVGLTVCSLCTQLTLLNPLSISAQKSIPLVVQNVKSAVESVCPKTVSISLIEEYGTSASLFPLKSSYTEYTFNRSSSTVLKHGP